MYLEIFLLFNSTSLKIFADCEYKYKVFIGLVVLKLIFFAYKISVNLK